MLTARIIAMAWGAVLCLCAAPNTTAQSVPSIAVEARTGRATKTSGLIFAVGELPDGRAVISDLDARAFTMVDFISGRVSNVDLPAGEGSGGPHGASSILHAGGNILLLYDGPGKRVLSLSPEGRIGAAQPITTPSGPTGRSFVVSSPLAIDSSGAFYALLEIADSNFTFLNLEETASIIRFTLNGKTQQEFEQVHIRRTGQIRTSPLTYVLPYLFRDGWALRGDGLFARVVADTYRVIWSRNGNETGRTAPLPYTAIPLTPAEQQAFRDSILIAWNPGRTANDTVNRPMRMPAMGSFPAEKPPIPSNPVGGTSALFDPLGRLWIVRERAHDDPVPHLDLIDEHRGLIAHIDLPRDRRLVGFGRTVVYLAAREGGQERLERYSLPRL